MVVLGRRTQAPKPLSRSQIVDDDSDSASDSEYGDVSCEECGSGDSPAELLLCDGCNCNRGYHLFCLRPILVHVPKGKWFGPCCSKNKKPKCTFLVDLFSHFRYLFCPDSLANYWGFCCTKFYGWFECGIVGRLILQLNFCFIIWVFNLSCLICLEAEMLRFDWFFYWFNCLSRCVLQLSLSIRPKLVIFFGLSGLRTHSRR